MYSSTTYMYTRGKVPFRSDGKNTKTQKLISEGKTQNACLKLLKRMHCCCARNGVAASKRGRASVALARRLVNPQSQELHNLLSRYSQTSWLLRV